jgi:vesicular inhibitory amino acid transporter
MTWDEYETGGINVPSGAPRGGDRPLLGTSGEPASSSNVQDHFPGLHRRRSSLVDTLRHAGGANSFDNFARSWQRAAGFHEITPSRPFYRLSDTDDTSEHDYRREAFSSPPPQSLLRAALQSERQQISDSPFDDEERGTVEVGPHGLQHSVEERLFEQRILREESIASIEPSLAAAFAESYSTSYGSMGTRLSEPFTRQADLMHAERLGGAKTTEEDKEREPLLLKTVQEDGKVTNILVGRSTLPQTVFNSANVLIGIGLLSLPLAMRYAGWVIGITVFVFSAVTTNYTAKLLAKCLDVDNSLVTFADLAYVAFGSRARIVTSLIFTLELLGACVALVVLFADSLHALIPVLSITAWKIVCGLILMPLAFFPLRLLSFTSVLGIMCCVAITVGLLIDGLVKPEQPGSLRQPAKTYLFPDHWGTVPLSFGLIMSPWGGHSVFPNIYRDMRHPAKFSRGVNITYAGSFLLDFTVAVTGILMFGDAVLDEVTSNIFSTDGYPRALSILIAICIAIIPLTKIPLNARPLISTVEVFLGLHGIATATDADGSGISDRNRKAFKIAIKIVTQVIFVLMAIVIPSFDRIMTLLGAVACFTICIIIPLSVHLKLFGKDLKPAEKWLNWVLIIVSAIMATSSTIFALLPKEWIGAA